MDYAKLFQELKRLDKKYNFFITLAEPPSKVSRKGKLAGIPMSVKDNICTKGLQTTAGSRILEGYRPVFDATAVARAKKEGALIIGKTGQDEFGFGSFSANCAYRIPKNPHDPRRVCGGSSGGAAGLTAALKQRHIALGQSTGGSISNPAAFCGVVGLTPTYGLVSRYGLVDFASSLDKIGPIARTVKDAALMLSVIAGHDDRDFTTVEKKPENYTKYTAKSLKGLKIGLPKEYFRAADKDVRSVVNKAVEKLEDLGAKTVNVSLPNNRYAIAAYYIIATAEASTNLARYCGMRYGAEEKVKGHFSDYFSQVRGRYFGEEAKRRIILGTYARMAGYRDKYYLRAMKVRTLIIEDFKKAFKKVDVLAAPTMPMTAPRIKEVEKLSPVEAYNMDILTVGPNLAGIPSLSVPAGTSKGMPVGLHLMADHLQEAKLIKAGSAFEAAG